MQHIQRTLAYRKSVSQRAQFIAHLQYLGFDLIHSCCTFFNSLGHNLYIPRMALLVSPGR